MGYQVNTLLMLEVCTAGGSSLGWNKFVEFIVPQSHVLNDLYYVSFGYSRQLPSCFFWTLQMFRLLLLFDCVIRICNICLFICTESIWVFFACYLIHFHPFSIAPIVCCMC